MLYKSFAAFLLIGVVSAAPVSHRGTNVMQASVHEQHGPNGDFCKLCEMTKSAIDQCNVPAEKRPGDCDKPEIAKMIEDEGTINSCKDNYETDCGHQGGGHGHQGGGHGPNDDFCKKCEMTKSAIDQCNVPAEKRPGDCDKPEIAQMIEDEGTINACKDNYETDCGHQGGGHGDSHGASNPYSGGDSSGGHGPKDDFCKKCEMTKSAIDQCNVPAEKRPGDCDKPEIAQMIEDEGTINACKDNYATDCGHQGGGHGP